MSEKLLLDKGTLKEKVDNLRTAKENILPEGEAITELGLHTEVMNQYNLLYNSIKTLMESYKQWLGNDIDTIERMILSFQTMDETLSSEIETRKIRTATTNGTMASNGMATTTTGTTETISEKTTTVTTPSMNRGKFVDGEISTKDLERKK